MLFINLKDIGSSADNKNKLSNINKFNFGILLFINIIINGIKDKNISGNVIERKLVAMPKKNPESIINKKKLLFCVRTDLTEKYIKKLKKKRNIVSDKTCEDNIIIKGESAANPNKINLCLGTIRLAIL